MHSNSIPKISIITPSFNQGQFLEKTILSVLNQNYPNLQYIIIDGASTDNSVDIIRKYEKQIDYWVSEKDNGQAEALNKGLGKATGDIIAWINSDDWYEENAFNEVASEFTNNYVQILVGKCKIWFSGNSVQPFVVEPQKYTYSSMLLYWKNNFIPAQPAVFFSRNAFQEAKKLDESLSYAMDMDLWLKICRKYQFSYTNKLLANYLIHNNSKSGSGFENFKPEWSRLAHNYLTKAKLNEKLYFYKNYILYLAQYIVNAVNRRLKLKS